MSEIRELYPQETNQLFAELGFDLDFEYLIDDYSKYLSFSMDSQLNSWIIYDDYKVLAGINLKTKKVVRGDQIYRIIGTDSVKEKIRNQIQDWVGKHKEIKMAAILKNLEINPSNYYSFMAGENKRLSLMKLRKIQNQIKKTG